MDSIAAYSQARACFDDKEFIQCLRAIHDALDWHRRGGFMRPTIHAGLLALLTLCTDELQHILCEE